MVFGVRGKGAGVRVEPDDWIVLISVLSAHILHIIPSCDLPHPSGNHLDQNGRSQAGSERYINAAQENVNLGEP